MKLSELNKRFLKNKLTKLKVMNHCDEPVREEVQKLLTEII
jgi:hypothetical protein